MLTTEQIIERRKGIGSSDAAAILGLPTFKGKNAFSVWLEKTDQLEPAKESDAMSAGNFLEPAILDYAEKKFGRLNRGVSIADPDGAPIASLLDGRLVSDGRPIEVKTAGIVSPLIVTWGEADTDQVPDSYMIQVQTQLLCTGAEFASLIALLGGRGIVEYTIARADPLIKIIRAVSADFFERYVQPRRDPRNDWAERLSSVHHVNVLSDPCEPCLDVVKRIRRLPNKTVQVMDIAPFMQWQELNRSRLAIEKSEKLALGACIAALGDAEAAELPGGVGFSYMEQNGADLIDRDKMNADGVYETYATPNRYRVARIKGVKK